MSTLSDRENPPPSIDPRRPPPLRSAARQSLDVDPRRSVAVQDPIASSATAADGPGPSAGPSQPHPPPVVDIFSQRWGLEGMPSAASLNDIVADTARGYFDLLLEPLGRSKRGPAGFHADGGLGAPLQHEERQEAREQMEGIARHLQQKVSGTSGEQAGREGSRPHHGMFMPTVYSQQEVLQLNDPEVVLILSSVLGPSVVQGDSIFDGIDPSEPMATPEEVESTFMPLMIKTVMDLYVTGQTLVHGWACIIRVRHVLFTARPLTILPLRPVHVLRRSSV